MRPSGSTVNVRSSDKSRSLLSFRRQSHIELATLVQRLIFNSLGMPSKPYAAATISSEATAQPSLEDVLDNASSQAQSSLLQLPAEVRRMILYRAFDCQNVHIFQSGHAIASLYCSPIDKALPCDLVDRFAQLERRCWKKPDPTEEDLNPEIGHRIIKVLGLPLTCRLLYADALPVLYERNKFSFNSFDVLGDFCSKMARHQPFKAGALQCLRSVRLYFDLHGFKVPLQPADFTRLKARLRLVADRAIALNDLIVGTGTWLPRLAAHPSVAPVREVIRALGQFRALKTFRADIRPRSRVELVPTNRKHHRYSYALRRVSIIAETLQAFVHLPREVRLSMEDFDTSFDTKYEALLGSEPNQCQ